MVRHPEKILVRIEKRGGERHPKTIILFSSFSEFFLEATNKGKMKEYMGKEKRRRTRKDENVEEKR